LARKDQVVEKLTRGVKGLLTKYKVDQIIGTASAIDAHHINVNGKVYGTKHLVIATGSLANQLPLPGFKEGRNDGVVIDSTAILSLPKIPKSLTVIGGGVIGIEFSCLFASLGTKVTIIQGLPTILEMLDHDVITLMTKEVTQKYGINLITNASVKEMSSNHELVYTVDGKTHKIKSEYVLESVGRHPVLDGFTNLGLEMNDRRGIKVNEHLETNLDNVYAIGDVIGKSMLAQVASHSGIVVANRIAIKEGKPGEGGSEMVMDYSRVPSCIYTHPEVAMIGKTEQQLIAEKIPYKSFKFPFAAIGKAQADDETDGFVKILMDPVYKTVLGAHIIGNRATELISEITTLIECEGTITELANAIHPHPTMSEAIGETAEALESGMPINL
jgi:dihydrolipoamide dehydrogenase